MSSSSLLLLSTFAAMLMALLLARPLSWLCARIGWVDKPDARKKHSGAIPLSGGLIILSSTAVTALLFQLPGYEIGLITAALLIFGIGFYDDRFPLRARYRFFCHLAAAALLIFASDTIVLYLGYCFGPVPVSLSFLAIPFTMVAIPGLINAYNMVDGADGLSGGQCLAAIFWIIVAACAIPVANEHHFAVNELGPVLFPIAGALVAFLYYNMRGPWRQRATLFMGDGGSMMLGLVIAWGVIQITNHYGPNGMGAASALWIVAVPLFDMFSAIIRRVAEGRTPMSPDRKHMHHLLIQRGMRVNGAVVTMNLVAFVCGGIGVVGWLAGMPQYYLFWPFVGLFAAYMVYAHRFWQTHDQSLATRQAMFKPIPERP